MATLVLSTVGTILGGPVGGAIGSLIGQSIDQQLLASPRRGPRLGDLSVQTSSYGTQIPRIYGTMRVAGSIVWATDLIESTTTTGAKGQPDETFSYSVSFAVALSSRSTVEIKRIWADGKLLRGEAGDFKVNTGFRFYPGNESQPIDPLIGSIEGLASTPAYRGLALAVFENLELAEFGNRIPFLTFEVVADTSTPTLDAILTDASRGRIDCSNGTTIGGYAAVGKSIAAAIEPLIESFSVSLLDDGDKVRSPTDNGVIVVTENDLGCAAEGRPPGRLERGQTPVRDLPNTLTLSHYDPAREYQTGTVRTDVGEESGSEVQLELPAVLAVADARTLVEDNLSRSWAQRDRLVLRLPPKFVDLRPGTGVEVVSDPLIWEVRRCTIDGMVAVAELKPAWRTAPALPAQSGRSVGDPDIVAGPITLSLVELPNPWGELASAPVIYVAASSPSSGWTPIAIEVRAGSFAASNRTASRKAMLGSTLTILPGGQAHLLDLTGSVEVQLIDEDQWLTSCDDEALAQGVNLARLGDELLQFGEVQALGPGRFRLSRLYRGRLATEWAMHQHAAGEDFVLIESSALQPVRLPLWTKNSVVSVTETGATGGVTAVVSATVRGDSTRPLPPVNLSAAAGTAAGELSVSWTRRSRQGWAWIDEIDAPLGESVERYAVTLEGTATTIERECNEPALSFSASEVAAAGAGLATISVKQVGDWAASRPAELSISLP